ncbi:hypothetical protein [Verrucosispora sp. ts21]|nr:hypothetical protein [Verrucosispora sp. ts21]
MPDTGDVVGVGGQQQPGLLETALGRLGEPDDMGKVIAALLDDTGE